MSINNQYFGDACPDQCLVLLSVLDHEEWTVDAYKDNVSILCGRGWFKGIVHTH